MSRFFLLLTLCAAASASPLSSTASVPKGEVVLVTGATGRTGSLLYNNLKTHGYQVRALVFNVTKAKALLHCGACGEAEGIFVGDVTQAATLRKPFAGVDRVAIACGSVPIPDGHGGYTFAKGGFPIDVEWHGTQNQVRAAVQGGAKHVLLISSMGTTVPDSFLDKLGNGWALFYKLNAEAYIMASQLAFTIVKPSGLTDTTAGKARLLVGHDDSITNQTTMSVPRADVARVLLQAILDPAQGANTRFDLSTDPSRPATGDFQALFAEAKKL